MNMTQLVGELWMMLHSSVAAVLLLVVTSSARRTGGNSLTYQLVEEQPADTFIGNIRQDLDLSSTATGTTFSLLAASAHFQIDPDSGILRTTDVIDRDDLCPGQSLCQLTANLVLRPDMYFHKVSIEFHSCM